MDFVSYRMSRTHPQIQFSARRIEWLRVLPTSPRPFRTPSQSRRRGPVRRVGTSRESGLRRHSQTNRETGRRPPRRSEIPGQRLRPRHRLRIGVDRTGDGKDSERSGCGE